MTIIFNYLHSYWSTFKAAYFITIVLLLSFFIYLNYYEEPIFSYFFSGHSPVQRFIGSYFLYIIPFASAYLLQLFFYNKGFLTNRWLWTIIILAPAFFSLRANFDLHLVLIRKWIPGIHHSLLQGINWIARAVILILLVFIIWYLRDRKNEPLYGSRPLRNYQPYFILIACTIPIIVWAATQHDFLNMYPRAKSLESFTTLRYLRIALFELCYGIDLLSIEFFFRGFLVVSLIRTCGMQCIIPAACFYCCIHFGKPMAEAISSFFGGMFLGIISYHTKSIWPGLVVHLGVAWLMELAGFISQYHYS